MTARDGAAQAFRREAGAESMPPKPNSLSVRPTCMGVRPGSEDAAAQDVAPGRVSETEVGSCGTST